mgnify:CR=1 FL=1
MLLQLDFSTATPIYQQIRDQIVRGLPTVRALASECGVNAMTVSKAYQLLKQEGHVLGDRRGGTFVCEPDGSSYPDSGIMDALRMRLAELVAGGMSGKEVLALCEHLLDEIAYR